MIRYALSIAALACAVGCTDSYVLHDTNAGPATNGPLTNADLNMPRTPAVSGVVVAPAPAVVAPAPAIVAVPQPIATYRIGTGVVDSVQQVSPVPSASAGSSTPSGGIYRLTVRMDDGSVQVIDQTSRAFRAGDRIRITMDGQVVVL